MKIASVTLAKNEGDVIESFVRHHCAIFDYVLVVNHDSVDATGSILRRLVQEGLPLVVSNDASLSYQQGPMTTRLARGAFERLGVDFVFPLDADEFVRVDSRDALVSGLKSIPSNHVGCLSWQNYIVSSDDSNDEIDPVRRIQHRASVEPKQEQKVVLGRGFTRNPALELSPGNHFLLDQTTTSSVAAATAIANASIAHFPVRSEAQFVSKALLQWMSVRLQNPIDFPSLDAPVTNRSLYWHTREMFAQVCSDMVFSTQRLQSVTWQYYVDKVRNPSEMSTIALTRDPLPVNHTLRYTDQTTANALLALARWADRLITRVGETMGE
ncbi:MAG: glycosyltransferase family 2 protein [Casimicrobium sp.]